mgnify:CR=1 FL=1
MSALEQRPRFQHLLPWPPEEVKSRLNQALGEPQAPVTGSVSGHHVFLKIPKHQRHVWTPQMDLELLPEGEDQTLVKALIGPSPSVWTRFVFIYAFAGFMVLFGIITGVPQWMLDKTPIGLFVAAGGGGLALVGYLFAASGKQLARMQTEVLRGFWLNLVREHVLPVEVGKEQYEVR